MLIAFVQSKILKDALTHGAKTEESGGSIV